MDESAVHRALLIGSLVAAAASAVYLLLRAAPYGRHGRAFGPTVNATFGWVAMELPAVVTIALLFALDRRADAVSIALLGLWELHYLQRTFVFPFRRRGGGRTPLVVVVAGALFNVLNGYLNGRWLFHFAPRPTGWLGDPRFLVGAALFVAGFGLNLAADRALINLRRPGETGYRVPRGPLFRFVSCPNYLGEMVEWCGWAIATWSL